MEITNSETDLSSIETLHSTHPVVFEASPDFFSQRRAVEHVRMRENIEFIVENQLNVPVMML